MKTPRTLSKLIRNSDVRDTAHIGGSSKIGASAKTVICEWAGTVQTFLPRTASLRRIFVQLRCPSVCDFFRRRISWKAMCQRLVLVRAFMRAIRLPAVRDTPCNTSCVPADEQTVVAWIHQRFVWHISALEESTHVIFYEDIQVWLS